MYLNISAIPSPAEGAQVRCRGLPRRGDMLATNTRPQHLLYNLQFTHFLSEVAVRPCTEFICLSRIFIKTSEKPSQCALMEARSSTTLAQIVQRLLSPRWRGMGISGFQLFWSGGGSSSSLVVWGVLLYIVHIMPWSCFLGEVWKVRMHWIKYRGNCRSISLRERWLVFMDYPLIMRY